MEVRDNNTEKKETELELEEEQNNKQKFLKVFLSKKKKILFSLLVFCGLVVVIVSLLSIFKGSNMVTVVKSPTGKPKAAKTSYKHTVNKQKKKTEKLAQKNSHVEKKTTVMQTSKSVSKVKKENIDVVSLLKEANEEAYVYQAKAKALKKKLEYLKLQREFQKLSNEISPASKPSVLELKLSEIQQKLYDIEKQLSQNQNGKKEEKLSLKEKLQQLKSQLLNNVLHPDNRKYELVAILGKEAVIKVDGKEISVKDGQELFGNKVKIEDFSVKIGDKVLSLDLSSKKKQSLIFGLQNGR